MAKFELKFIDLESSYSFIKVEVGNVDFYKCISIYGETDGDPFLINMDKSTAIKFAKTLRTEINKITESEVKTDYVDLFKDKIDRVICVSKNGHITESEVKCD